MAAAVQPMTANYEDVSNWLYYGRYQMSDVARSGSDVAQILRTEDLDASPVRETRPKGERHGWHESFSQPTFMRHRHMDRPTVQE